MASSKADAAGIRTGLETWATTHGFTLKTDIVAGPTVLEVEVVQKALDPLADCGPLRQLDPPSGGYPLGATVTVTGDAVASGLDDAITVALDPLIGDRKVQVSLNVLNDHLCRVRSELPGLPTNAISIWMGQGATGESNLTGVYKTGDYPIVDVLIPANITNGQLWVVAVDSSGKVYNILPNESFLDNDIARLGVIEGGTRRIRVVHSFEEKKADPRRIALRVNQEDYGKSEFIAFVTQGALFDTRRPRDESVASFAEALAAAQAERPGNILGFASRILESRP
ncbi:hypothetical protein MASR1M32_16050 [Rhodobacter sp.]